MFSFLVVLTLALGIGANSAIFDAVYESVWKPPPFSDPAGLVMLFDSEAGDGGGAGDVAPGNFEDWRELNRSFVDMAAMAQTSMNLTGSGEPERVSVHRVSASLFAILGVEPLLGRAFVNEEDSVGGPRAVLLAHGFWQRRFGGDDGVLGRDIRLDDEPHRVVGVLPPRFGFPSRETSLFVPMAMGPEEKSSRSSHYLDVVARLRAGVSVPQAAQEMDAIALELAELYPETNAGNGVALQPLRERLASRGTRPLVVLLIAVAAVFLIAVINVANLLLARSATREREVAIRAALGASRSRILAQMLTESALLAFCGAAAGVVLAIWVRQWLYSITPDHVTTATEAWRPVMFVFTLILASAVTVLMGLLPALRLSRFGHRPPLALRTTTSRLSSRFRSGLIVGEVAVALVLLVVGGLMARSFFVLTGANPGLRADNVLTMRIELSGSRYREHHQRVAFYRELESRLMRLPGVRSAGFVTMLPLTFAGGSILFGHPEGDLDEGREPIAVFRSVSADYFKTLGIPVLAGRAFTPYDREESPRVAIVNRTLARELFPDEDVLGKRLDIWGEDLEVVGVVADVRQLAATEEVRPAIYVASEQRSYGFFDPRDLAIHTDGDPLALVPSVRAEVWAIDADQPIASIRTMDAIVSGAVANERMQALLLTAFGTLGLMLAALGIYGVLSHTVSQRTGEIGLRMALGARAVDVLRLVAGRGLGLALVGVALGLVGAAAAGQFVESMLHGVEPLDPWTILVVTLVLSIVAAAACVGPACRATRIDPLDALREE